MSYFEKEYFLKAYGGEYERRNPPCKLLYYLKVIRKLKPSGSLLDVGCAYGLFLARARAHYDVTGADASSFAVEEARKRLQGCNIMQSDIESLSLGRTFDVITCFDVLEHVNNVDLAIKNILQFLEQEGIFVITAPVYDTLAGKMAGLLDNDETHVWKMSRHFWKAKLKAHGLNIVQEEGLWRYNMPGRFYLFWGGGIWKKFSPAILLIGERA